MTEESQISRKAEHRLTERDREIMGFVAVARYLSQEQIGRLLFPGAKSRAAEKRLNRLGGLWGTGVGEPYMKLIPLDVVGQKEKVWALTDKGYAVAAELLGELPKVPRHEVKPFFMRHALLTNDLLVSLAMTGRGGRPATVRELSFRWLGSESVCLSYSEYDTQHGTDRGHYIRPDATVEMPAHRKRFFVECETGTHSIVKTFDDKGGSTLRKLEAYSEFLTGHVEVNSRTTFYGRAYPDGWPAEVVFMVPSAKRRDHIREAFARWQEQTGSSARFAVVLTFEEAQARLGGFMAGGTSGPAPRRPEAAPVAPPALVKTFTRFYNEAVLLIRESRRWAREENRPVPPYPADTEALYAELSRLGS